MKCFVIAMQAEASPILSLMDEPKERAVHSLRVVYGKLFGEQVRVIICGVGKVNASRATQYAIDMLGATTIINIGTSGGLIDGLKIGEVYEVTSAMQYDFDLVQINGTTIGTLNEFETPFLPLAHSSTFEGVICATGDRFNDSEVDFELIRSLGCTVRDMELGAIAQVCVHAGVKVYAFKVISDLHGLNSTTEQFTLNLQKCALSLKAQAKKILEATND